MKKTLIPLMLICSVLASGCGTTGTDRPDSAKKSAGTVLDDATITSKVKAALIADPDISAFKINVDTDKGVVKLKGEIKSLALRRKVETIVRGVEGVQSINNQLIITG
jgi:hyperosmotically inducible protein